MKQIMIRLIALMSTLPFSGMVNAHPHHPDTSGISHDLVGQDSLAIIFVLVLVVACCWALARR